MAGLSTVLECTNSILPASGIQLVAYPDMHGDGVADVLALCALPSTASAVQLDWTYLDLSSSGIGAQPIAFEGTQPSAPVGLTSAAVIGDIDGNGLLDLVVTADYAFIDIVLLQHEEGSGAPINISAVFPTAAGGNFVDDSTTPLNDVPSSVPDDTTAIIAAGDTNGDGLLEFMVGVDSRLYLLRMEPMAVDPSLPFTKPFNLSNLFDFRVYATFIASGQTNLHYLRWLRYMPGGPHRYPGPVSAILQVQSLHTSRCGDVVVFEATITPQHPEVAVSLPSNCIQEDKPTQECCRGPNSKLYNERHVYSIPYYGGMPCGQTVIQDTCFNAPSCTRTHNTIPPCFVSLLSPPLIVLHRETCVRHGLPGPTQCNDECCLRAR